VYDIHQDKKGFMWFATDNGVVRYDGRNMEVFQLNDGLQDPVVFEFIEDSKDRLWFRTFSGRLSYFHNEQIHSYTSNFFISNTIETSLLVSIQIDNQGQVWFGSNSMAGKIDEKGIVSTEHLETGELSIKNKESGFVYSYSGATNKIHTVIFDDQKMTIALADTINAHPRVCTIEWDKLVYFSIGSCLYKKEGNSIKLAFQGRDQIISVSKDNQNNLWIGYLQKGLECLTNLNQRRILYLDFLQSKGITKVVQDKEDGYWISTLQEGVYYIPNTQLIAYDLPVHSKITSTYFFGNQTVIADDQGSLLVLDTNGLVTLKKKLGNPIINMAGGPNQTLWASTPSTTYIFEQSSLKLVRSVDTSLSGISVDTQGLVHGICRKVTFVFDAYGNIQSRLLSDKVKRSIFCSDQFIFNLDRVGLEVTTYKGTKVTLPKFFENIKPTKVMALRDSLVIVGTLGSGFLIVDQSNWTYRQYFSKSGIVANNIYALLVVNDDLWLGTEKGVAKVSISSLLQGKSEFSFVSKNSRYVNERVSHLTFTGKEVWAYTENSFYTIPKDLKINSSPTFFIQSIKIDDQPFDISSSHKLTNQQNSIQIDFRLIDFKNHSFYTRSRLSPQSPWNYSTEENLKLHSLSAGDYSLEIDYSTNNQHWNKALNWNFTVLPVWWKTWYFYLSVMVAIVSITTLFFKRRVSLIKERNKYLGVINGQQQKLIRAEVDTLERERGRIAKELHDSIGTNLTAIKMIVRGLLLKHQEPKAELIENEFQGTISDIKSIIHELVPQGLDRQGLISAIENYVGKIEENLSLKIEVNSFGPGIEDSSVNLTIFRILQELLSNTLKHSEASKVVIHVNTFEDLLSVIYQDNGNGFDEVTVKKGSGLLNIEARLQVIQGKLTFESGDEGVSYFIDVPINSKTK
jgi:signal transduction histidine kinase/ligand-binding sensor domain-containing protein